MSHGSGSRDGITWHLSLLDGFRLRGESGPVEVTGRGQRLVALLAVRGPLLRTVAAGLLWPEVLEERARASVRAAISGLQRRFSGLLEVSATDVRLADSVEVDLARFLMLTRGGMRLQPGEPVGSDALELLPGGSLAGRLLPGWSDDWVLAEGERLFQLRLHALDALAARFLDTGNLSMAIEAATAAVQADPLRESAQRRLMQAYLAEGNAAAALRQFSSFRDLLRQELGISPSRLITTLVEEIRRSTPLAVG